MRVLDCSVTLRAWKFRVSDSSSLNTESHMWIVIVINSSLQ